MGGDDDAAFLVPENGTHWPLNCRADVRLPERPPAAPGRFAVVGGRSLIGPECPVTPPLENRR